MAIGKYYEASIEEADQYLKTAVGGLKPEKVFTPEILYNILGMAIEKYCLALLYYKETMPDNHTFHDLVDAEHRGLSSGRSEGRVESPARLPGNLFFKQLRAQCP